MMLIPYAVDVPLDRRPFVNWLLLASLVAVFAVEIAAAEYQIEPYVLDGWTLRGLLGHMWLHAGPFHLAGNMLFLWIFGNAVCAKVGNLFYLPLYLLFGLVAAVCHLIFVGEPAVGASGAINGIVGMFLVFYALNDISCFFFIWLIFPFIRTFSVSSYWMILLWLVFDILGALIGGGQVAYFAHLGGFAAGAGIAVLLYKTGWVQMGDDEKCLVQIIEEHLQQRQDEALERQARLALDQAEKEAQETSEPPTVQSFQEPVMIRFNCTCGKPIKVPLQYSGKTGRCPHCGREVKVPVFQIDPSDIL